MSLTPIPVKAGSAIIFNATVIHGSLPNLSNGVRFSLDFRYHIKGSQTGRAIFEDLSFGLDTTYEDVLSRYERVKQFLIANSDNQFLGTQYWASRPMPFTCRNLYV